MSHCLWLHFLLPGAFSPKHTYSLNDIKDIVGYASERGIAVLPELDMPGK